MTYETIIGLEVHVQLLTRSKMFCACATNFGDEPNTNICPVCTGQPGTLPVVNKKAIEFAIRAGLATGCSIDKVSIFSRKNYFYPDLPKGYQISQYDRPICKGGNIDINLGNSKTKKISITRIHLEEDAGKFLHDTGSADRSHVDFNRCGIPLIEIVSGPDMRSPQEGILYLKTIRNILMYIEVCDGNMQEGSFRVDANISIRPVGTEKFGTRTELKNLNSFKAIESALTYEVDRQTRLLDGGGKVRQETLLWNAEKGVTESMRSKEEAHDYRYFPEPDLPPLTVEEKWISDIKKNLPELANQKAERFVKTLGIPEYDAHVLTQEKALANYYESAVACVAPTFRSGYAKKISNWIMTELLRELKNANTEIDKSKISAKDLARLVELVETDKISGKIGKTVFEEMFASGKTAEDIIKEKGLIQVSDTGEIEKIIEMILTKNQDNVAKYKSGKTGVFGHFVGEVMKESKGKANPRLVNEILKRKLE